MKSFCISLEKNKDRWDEILTGIRKAGFEDVEIFKAVNGNEIGKMADGLPVSQDTEELVNGFGGINKLMSPWALYMLKKGIERKNHAQLSSWGAVGCYMSHVLVWLNMIDANEPYCVVFEDDVSVGDNFKEEFEKRIQFAPDDADVIVFGALTNFSPTKYNEYFNKIGGVFFGLHAYIITNKGARKILKNAFPIEVQLDSNMSYTAFLDNVKMYDMHGMCGQKMHKSSIQKDCRICNLSDSNVKLLFLMYFVLISVLLFMFIRSHTAQE